MFLFRSSIVSSFCLFECRLQSWIEILKKVHNPRCPRCAWPMNIFSISFPGKRFTPRQSCNKHNFLVGAKLSRIWQIKVKWNRQSPLHKDIKYRTIMIVRMKYEATAFMSCVLEISYYFVWGCGSYFFWGFDPYLLWEGVIRIFLGLVNISQKPSGRPAAGFISCR